jgi:hypothetical protein
VSRLANGGRYGLGDLREADQLVLDLHLRAIEGDMCGVEKFLAGRLAGLGGSAALGVAGFVGRLVMDDRVKGKAAEHRRSYATIRS